MRLLILSPEFAGGGGGIITFYRTLAPALRDLGVDIKVIEGSALHAGARSPRAVGGVAVETLEKDRLLRWWDRFPAFAAAPGLRRHLAAAWAMWEQADFGAGADIVEATDWGLLFLPAAVEARAPLVVQGHGSVGQIAVHDPLEGEETQNALERLLEVTVLSAAPKIQTYSHANAAFWRVQTGRDVAMICPAAPLPPILAAGAPSDRGLVVGRIQRWKGPQVLCRALARLGERAPCVDWVGRDTPHGRRDTSTATHLAAAFPDQWGRRIVSHPPVDAVEVARRQAGALFNLVPSTWDVFNFTVVEAMASGRPTIVSAGAGAGELIDDGENGFLFAAGDDEALAQAIDRVLAASPAQRAAIGARARETVRRELDPAMIAQARLAAYREAMADFHRAPPPPIGGWLGELTRPGDPAAANTADFLGQFPMRAIAGHLAGRLAGRVGGALASGPGRR